MELLWRVGGRKNSNKHINAVFFIIKIVYPLELGGAKLIYEIY